VSDDSVRQALRSNAGLVVVEAPAGCGKTHQGAEYAVEVAENNRERVLILTHTHAACSVFGERTRGIGSHVIASSHRLPPPIMLGSALPRLRSCFYNIP
jgi:Rad3-related DNA helicase